jgi:cytochrome c oxidase subunit 2
MKKLSFFAASAMTAAIMTPAFASRPEDGKLSFQDAATPLAEEVHVFHNVVLMPVITFISLFVLALLIWIIVRYNSKSNPEPQKFSHNTMLEVLWTGIPIFILLYIALFSFDLLYKSDVIPDGVKVVYEGDGQTTDFVIANDFTESRNIRNRNHVEVYKVSRTGAKAKLDYGVDYQLDGLGKDNVIIKLASAAQPNEEVEIVGGRSRSGPEPFLGLFGEDRSSIVTAPTVTIKATGWQWYWQYNYPDFGDFEFNATMVQKEDLEDKGLYLLETDNRMVVPAGETIRIITTAQDVIHSWTIPAFAIKVDAVPGRLNETWFQAPDYRPDGTNVYYGQCSEICGINHAYMPIALEVMPREEFEAWVDEQRELAGLTAMFTKDETKLAAATDGAVAE